MAKTPKKTRPASKTGRGRAGSRKKAAGRSTATGKTGRPSKKKALTRKGVERAVIGGAQARLAPANFVTVLADEARDNLNKIEHIVVLVMENRSFDHMLGYLKLVNGRTDVDGLTSDMSNSLDSQTFTVRHLTETAFGKDQDPCHTGECVTEQLSNGNGGFVLNYVRTRKKPDDADPGLVMGFYDGTDLPVYDHFARNFAICDRWFCSVDGATWPNRLYAVTGRADGKKRNKTPPIYDLPSFVRHLDAKRVSWRWYCHDIATLRLTDSNYRPPLHHRFKNFSFFDRRSLLGGNSFLEDAAEGTLAPVSWIDPNFVDLGIIGLSGSNDDHPPSDVTNGQDLALRLYNAVINSPQWKKTMLVIIYDEHGGFFDHVPTQPAEDDDPNFRRTGVRVPAFIISPWVERGKVSSMVFDHTSIIKTILLRFCKQDDGSIPDMGARVTHANHLGSLLTQTTPREAPQFSSFQHLVERLASWRSERFKTRMLAQVKRELPQPPELNDLQQGVIAAKKRLRAQGLPEGQP